VVGPSTPQETIQSVALESAVCLDQPACRQEAEVSSGGSRQAAASTAGKRLRSAAEGAGRQAAASTAGVPAGAQPTSEAPAVGYALQE
jgi:hypothetical protein